MGQSIQEWDQVKLAEDSLQKNLKSLQIFQRLSSNFTWSILEYLGPNVYATQTELQSFIFSLLLGFR